MDAVNESIINQAVALQKQIAQPVTSEAVHFIVVPKDCEVKTLQSHQYPHGVPPSRIIQSPTFFDAASFSKYVITYRDIRTRVLANPETFAFTALLDYHQGAMDEGAEKLKPEFVSHRASFRLTESEQWKVWFGNHDKLIPQTQFAEFLEDNRRDIFKPSAADMMEVARDLQAKTEVNFDSKVTLKDGSATLRYQEQVTAGVGPAGNIAIPDEFSIRIPVFYGEAPVEISAKLRFRISGGKLSFLYRLYRPVETRNEAFNATVERVATELTQPVWLGKID